MIIYLLLTVGTGVCDVIARRPEAPVKVTGQITTDHPGQGRGLTGRSNGVM